MRSYWMSFVDCIFPNEKEAAYYTGETEHEAMADAFLARGVSRVVIKLGADGCYAKDENEGFYLPALPLDAIDTTGAGDHFVAGFIGGVMDGMSFRECCERGSMYAAQCVAHVGGSAWEE